MEVKAVVAFPVTDLVEVRFALLFAKGHEGRHHEEATDEAGYEPQSDQVLDSDIRRMLDSLLQVHALVHVAAEHADLEEKPGAVDYSHHFDGLVQRVRRFVQFGLIVEEE